MSLNLNSVATLLLALTVIGIPDTAMPAPSTSPDALVKSTVDEMLDAIKRTKDKRALRQLAEQKVLPNFDFKEMTRLAVGPAWRDASPSQQQSLESGFRSVLVNTYTAALSRGVSGEQSLEIKPVQPQADQKEVTVKTVVKQSGKQPVPIDYRMTSSADGWKVFDVLVDGLSLVTTYRGTFAEEIKRSGIDGLIKALDDKNRTLAAG